MILAFLAALAVCRCHASRPVRKYQRHGQPTESLGDSGNQPAEGLAALDATVDIMESSESAAHLSTAPGTYRPAEGKVSEKAGPVSTMTMSLVEYLIAAAPDERYGHIEQDVQYSTFWEELLTLPMRKPRSFNAVLATVKTWLADFIIQLTEIRSGAKAAVDWKRSAAFALFGFFYIGLAQWVLYVSLMAYLAPSAIVFSNEPMRLKLHDWAGQEDLLKQVMIDNLFLAAFIYFPVFYMLKEFVSSGCSSLSSLLDGLRRYQGNFISDNTLSMCFWLPGDMLAFAAPIYMRLPLEHAVSFGWTMVLSYRRGGAGTTSKEMASQQAHGDALKSAVA